jgi:hypothetical protein
MSHVHSQAPPLTLTRTASERTSFVAAIRGLACNTTREVRLSGREGAFAVHREVRARDYEQPGSPLAVRDGAAQQHTRTEMPIAAADRARRALQMDARVKERTTKRGSRRMRCRGERVLNECTKVSAARRRRGGSDGERSGRAPAPSPPRTRRSSPSVVRIALPSSCGHQQLRLVAVGPCGAASAAYPLLFLMDASAPAPSSSAVASAWPLKAAQCSGVHLRATAAPVAALAQPDPPRSARADRRKRPTCR